MTTTAVSVFQEIKQAVEDIKNDEHQIAGSLSVKDGIRQGDVYIVCLPEVPEDAKRMGQVQMQLAPGTTQGSRHILESAEGVTMYTWERFQDNPLSGPILECKQPVRITHPEHGDWTIPEGVWHCRYQRAFAEELRRVQD